MSATIDRASLAKRLRKALDDRRAEKSLMGKRTADETRELLRHAVVARVGRADGTWSYVRDFSDTELVYEVSGDMTPAKSYVASYVIDALTDAVFLGDGTEVDVETVYEPKNSVPFFGAGSGLFGSTVAKAVAGPVMKSDEAKRYTFAPMYPASPESPEAAHLDAHGDFATADDLQGAVWDYVRKGDRAIRRQHTDGTVVGECVEIVSWPFATTMPMTCADGSTVTKEYEAGTVFLGAVWTPEAWPDVVSGKLSGYSLGGSAVRVDVEVEG